MTTLTKPSARAASTALAYEHASDLAASADSAIKRMCDVIFNVLRGDMSLVGPRPPLPSEVAQYEPRVMGKFAVRPGITGLWQISGRSNLSWDETVHLDLSYAQHRSLTLDAWIMLQTVPALLRHEGAY